jgi:hypothetical protein
VNSRRATLNPYCIAVVWNLRRSATAKANS